MATGLDAHGLEILLLGALLLTAIPSGLIAASRRFTSKMRGFRPTYDTRPFVWRATFDSAAYAFFLGGVTSSIIRVFGWDLRLRGVPLEITSAVAAFLLVAIMSPRRWANVMAEESGTQPLFSGRFSKPGTVEDSLVQLLGTGVLIAAATNDIIHGLWIAAVLMVSVTIAHGLAVLIFQVVAIPRVVERADGTEFLA